MFFKKAVLLIGFGFALSMATAPIASADAPAAGFPGPEPHFNPWVFEQVAAAEKYAPGKDEFKTNYISALGEMPLRDIRGVPAFLFPKGFSMKTMPSAIYFQDGKMVLVYDSNAFSIPPKENRPYCELTVWPGLDLDHLDIPAQKPQFSALPAIDGENLYYGFPEYDRHDSGSSYDYENRTTLTMRCHGVKTVADLKALFAGSVELDVKISAWGNQDLIVQTLAKRLAKKKEGTDHAKEAADSGLKSVGASTFDSQERAPEATAAQTKTLAD